MFEDDLSSGEEEGEALGFPSKEVSVKNYDRVGLEVLVPESGPNLYSHHHLLSDNVHCALQGVLNEDVRLPFVLSDLQKLSLHALGSLENYASFAILKVLQVDY